MQTKKKKIMNAIKKIITLSILGSVLIFAGCEKDDSVTTMEKEEAKETLQKNDRQIKASLEEIENTDGMQAMKTLNELDPFSDLQKSSHYETVPGHLQEILKPINENHLKRSAEKKFNFDDWVGTYTWKGINEWSITPGEPDDQIIIKFPADTTQDPVESNAVLTIDNYHEFETTDSSGNTIYVADTVKMHLTIGEEEVLDIDYTLDYNKENDMVTALAASVFVKPFSWELAMSENTIEAALLNENENVVIAFSFKVSFTDNMENVEKLNGHVQLHNLNLEGEIKPHNFQRLKDTTFLIEQELTTVDDIVEYVNEQMDISMYHVDTGTKIADIKAVKDDEKEGDIPVKMALVFKDDSTEPAKQYFQNVIDFIKNMMERYEIEAPEI